MTGIDQSWIVLFDVEKRRAIIRSDNYNSSGRIHNFIRRQKSAFKNSHELNQYCCVVQKPFVETRYSIYDNEKCL
jgi:hypothetical protein